MDESKVKEKVSHCYHWELHIVEEHRSFCMHRIPNLLSLLLKLLEGPGLKAVYTYKLKPQTAEHVADLFCAHLQALAASSVFDKIKSALPFQTLPMFELAEAEDYQTPPQENQNADLGPNEVTKESIGDISLDANNPFDTAAPGEIP